MAQPPTRSGNKPPSLCKFCFNTSISRWVVKYLQYPDGLPRSVVKISNRGLALLWQCSFLELIFHGVSRKALISFKEEHQVTQGLWGSPCSLSHVFQQVPDLLFLLYTGIFWGFIFFYFAHLTLSNEHLHFIICLTLIYLFRSYCQW